MRKRNAEDLISAQKQLVEAYREQEELLRKKLQLIRKEKQQEENIFSGMEELRRIVTPHLEPHIKAMLTASGITKFQAKTIVYYALGCYHLKEFERYPLLTLFGETGTGKSEAMKQITKLLPEWKLIESKATYSDLAKGLDNRPVIVIEEADSLKPQERCEGLLQDRTQKTNRIAVIHIPPAQTVKEIDNWGATILHKRDGFNDIATRNRSIIIKTEKRQGYWQVTDVDKTGFVEVAKAIGHLSSYVFEEILLEERVSSRTLDMWKPVIRIAEACGDVSYLESCKEMLKREMLKVIADDEPLTVTAQSLISAYYGKEVNREPDFTKNIRLTEVVNACKNDLMVNMSPQKLKANLRELGYRIGFYIGNNWIEANPELTQKLESKVEG